MSSGFGFGVHGLSLSDSSSEQWHVPIDVTCRFLPYILVAGLLSDFSRQIR